MRPTTGALLFWVPHDPALVRSRLATLQASLVIRRLGKLASTDLQRVWQALGQVFGPSRAMDESGLDSNVVGISQKDNPSGD